MEWSVIMELSMMEKKKIEDKVSELLQKYGYDPKKDTYVDVVSFVGSEGFKVGIADLDETEDGFIIVSEKFGRIIGVNDTRPIEWKRFVIGHEFGHFVLSQENKNLFLHRENIKGKNEEENDADYFAAALLMPKESFIRTYKENQGKMSTGELAQYLSKEYRVTEESVRRRIEEVIFQEEEQ